MFVQRGKRSQWKGKGGKIQKGEGIVFAMKLQKVVGKKSTQRAKLGLGKEEGLSLQKWGVALREKSKLGENLERLGGKGAQRNTGI